MLDGCWGEEGGGKEDEDEPKDLLHLLLPPNTFLTFALLLHIFFFASITRPSFLP